MDIEHLHLYVRDAAVWRDWFVEKLNFQPTSAKSLGGLSELAVKSAQIRILISSERTGNPSVKEFLGRHSEGIADVAFRVENLESALVRVKRAGGRVSRPIYYQKSATKDFRCCCIAGWGSVSHTLIEYQGDVDQDDILAQSQPGEEFGDVRASGVSAKNLSAKNREFCPPRQSTRTEGKCDGHLPWIRVDHAVLNVPVGQLERAAAWYEHHLGFVRQQQFAIATAQSGLRSFVLKHPDGNATLPINEPTSSNSQIQEFLELNRGAGIQHVALQTENLVRTVATLRRRGVPFLSVPSTYYRQLQERPGFWREAGDWDAIAQQQILVDWPPAEPQTRLLQTFTQPIFEQPTFFWELIERQTKSTQTGIKRAEGFGEGNFQALFEAIEREQQQRGSL